jgi:hypothetical protein
MALGRDLGVSYVVRGSVQSGPGTLRLAAHLADATTGQVLWSGSYDRALTPDNLLGMESELSAAVATALGEPYGVLHDATSRRLAAAGAPSMPTYACILRAYEYRRSFSDALFAPAMACLKAAVVQDPDYADAWAMLGWLHLDAARMDLVPAAEHASEMAAALDATSHAVDLDRTSQQALEALDTKRDRLVARAKQLTGDGRAVLIFTGYSDTMAYLRDALVGAFGTSVASYSGEGGALRSGTAGSTPRRR